MEVIKMRTCKICSMEKEEKENFNFHKTTGYYFKTCKDCANKKRRLNREISFGRREDSIFIRQKKCITCNIIKDINEENFYKGRTYSKTCKECRITKTIKNRTEKLNKGYLPDNTIKKCIKCAEEKYISEFSFSRKIKYYSSYCKPCDVIRKYEAKQTYSKERIEQDLQKGRDWHKNNPDKSAFTKYKAFDFNRGLAFDLTLDYIKDQLVKSCTYCQYPSTGLDRVDNSKGHLQNNCIPCCWECNTARMNNFTYEEMLVIGQAIKLVKDNRKCQH